MYDDRKYYAKQSSMLVIKLSVNSINKEVN